MFPLFYMLIKKKRRKKERKEKKVGCSGFRCGEIVFSTIKGINQIWEFVKRLKIHTKPAVN